MPSLTKIFSKSKESKEKEALREGEAAAAAATSADNSPPPAYSAEDGNNPSALDLDHAELPPSLTAGFDNLRLTHSEIPQREQLIAHLKLLECFYRLRQTVASTDGLFGISNATLTDLNNGSKVDDPKLLSALGEKRWEVYIYRAVDRFQRWRDAVAPEQISMKSKQTVAGGSLELLIDGTRRIPGMPITIENLPPIGEFALRHLYRGHH